MVTAGEKRLVKMGWGDAEQFHTVEQNGNRFWLYDIVKITTKAGMYLEGEIVYITEKSVDILPDYMSAQTINFEDIETISY